jgi:mRNA interferase MazF
VARKLGRGDVVWLEFTPTKGHEQSGRRPALVLSPAQYNEKSGLMLVCPITSQLKGYPFEVVLDGKIKGAILVDQLRSVDWKERNAAYVTTASTSTVAKVKELLELLLP